MNESLKVMEPIVLNYFLGKFVAVIPIPKQNQRLRTQQKQVVFEPEKHKDQAYRQCCWINMRA